MALRPSRRRVEIAGPLGQIPDGVLEHPHRLADPVTERRADGADAVHDEIGACRLALELGAAPKLAHLLTIPSQHDEAAEVATVRLEEDGLEAVVPVHEREVEAPALGEQARQDDLRLLELDLDEIANASLLSARSPAPS